MLSHERQHQTRDTSSKVAQSTGRWGHSPTIRVTSKSCWPLATRSSRAAGFPGRVELLHLGLLASQFFVNRLDVIVSFLAQRHFLDEASRFAHQGLFFGFDDLERGVCPIYVCQLRGLGERLA